MMKLMTGYSVAVYTAEKCTLYDTGQIDEVIDYIDQPHYSGPDIIQLKFIQKSLTTCSGLAVSPLMILVPDDWLSTSKHSLDRTIDSALLPLVALSYAVETTFSAPETLLFSYQQEITQDKQCQLTVFSCSADWSEQLCLPFTEQGRSCLVMPITQWRCLKTGKKTWSYLAKQALSVYQPDYEKRKKRKRLWMYLILLSVLIHSVACVYYFSLLKNTEQALVDRQGVLAKKALWASEQETNAFVESALTLVQALPSSVRLVSFNGKSEVVSLQLSLSLTDLNIVQESWRKHYPSWHWKIEPTYPLTDSYQQRFYQLQSTPLNKRLSHLQGDGLLNGQEVLDVSVSIFKS